MPRYPRPDYIPSAPFSSPVQDNEDGSRSFPVFQTHRQGGTVGFAPSAFSHPYPSGYGSPHDFGGYGGGQQYDSAPSMNYSQPPSAPSFDRMLGMANRGQIARGPSPGFAAGQINQIARGEDTIQHGGHVLDPNQLLQMGETAPGYTMRLQEQQNFRDANSRLNSFNSAQTGLMGSEGRLNDATSGATSMIAPSTARYNDARSRALDTTAPSEARFNDARATQTSQMPEDWKLREAELMRQLTTLQQSHDRLSNQLRLSQQQGGGQVQDVRKTGGLTQDQYLQNYTKMRESAAKEDIQDGTNTRKRTPQEVDQYVNGAMGKWDPRQGQQQQDQSTPGTSTPANIPQQQAPPAAPPPVNTYGAQPQQAQQQQGPQVGDTYVNKQTNQRIRFNGKSWDTVQ